METSILYASFLSIGLYKGMSLILPYKNFQNWLDHILNYFLFSFLVWSAF